MANEEDVLTFKLQSFEGPLDLLLHLIKQNEMDIYDIEMVAITSQYLDYLHRMKKMQLDIAGEYLVMAATLLNIKSRLLLPNEQAPQVEDETYEDPREELVQQLLLHQAFKEQPQILRLC
ncbi:segregation and condensation protein A [Ligilactobacillus equi]|uniref:segregation and condensation protein A n=1 Tax=Ligilactobacillus equi TaxID=137357 RepID=UPI000B0705C9|nr:segregation/condensation protein A [Ligilactobacillus equi]